MWRIHVEYQIIQISFVIHFVLKLWFHRHLTFAVCDILQVVAIGKKLLVMQWRHSAAWTAWCPASDTDTVDGFQYIRVSAVISTNFDSFVPHSCIFQTVVKSGSSCGDGCDDNYPLRCDAM
jgi:hypothetical protein